MKKKKVFIPPHRPLSSSREMILGGVRPASAEKKGVMTAKKVNLKKTKKKVVIVPRQALPSSMCLGFTSIQRCDGGIMGGKKYRENTSKNVKVVQVPRSGMPISAKRKIRN